MVLRHSNYNRIILKVYFLGTLYSFINRPLLSRGVDCYQYNIIIIIIIQYLYSEICDEFYILKLYLPNLVVCVRLFVFIPGRLLHSMPATHRCACTSRGYIALAMVKSVKSPRNKRRTHTIKLGKYNFKI